MRRTRLIYYNLAISAITLVLIVLMELRDVYEFMLIYSLNSVLVFGMLVREELLKFRGLNLNLLFLVGSFMRFVLPSVTHAWGALNGESYSFVRPVNDYTDYMFPTVVWMNIYYSIFYWCFLRFDMGYTIENAIKPFLMRIKLSQFTLPVFIIGILYKIVASNFPVGFIPGFISNVLGQLATLAILAQLFESIFKPTRFNRILFYIFIFVSMWETLVFGFYKGAVMMNFIYFMLYYFLNRKYYNQPVVTPRFIIGIVGVLMFFNMIIYPFMTLKRIEAGWDVTAGGIVTRDYSNVDVLMEVLSGKEQKEKDDHTAADRLDAIGPNAYFYKECCQRGLRTTKLLVSNLELLVPRFLYPEKHDSEAGLMVYAYATTGRFENYSSAISNNYVGQFASAYLIGGGIMVIFLAFLNGWFTMFYYNFLVKRVDNFFSIILLVSLVLSTILAYEEIHDGGALRIGYNCVMMIVVWILTNFFPGFLSFKGAKSKRSRSNRFNL